MKKEIVAKLKVYEKDLGKSIEVNIEAYKQLFRTLLDSVREQGVQMINPLQDKARKFLKQITRQEPIPNPGEKFEAFITPDSYAAVSAQVNSHKIAIREAIDRDDMYYVKYLLDELHYLSSTLGEDQVEMAFTETTNYLCKKFTSEYEKAKTAFNRCLWPQNTLNQLDIDEYKKYQSKIAKTKSFSCIIDQLSVSENNYLQNVSEQLYGLCKNLTRYSEDYVSNEHKIFLELEKLVLLSNNYEDDKQLLKQLTEHYLKHYDEKCNEVERLFTQQMEIAEASKKMHCTQVLGKIMAHLGLKNTQFEELISKCRTFLSAAKNDIIEITKTIDRDAGILPNQLKRLSTNFELLNISLETTVLHNYIPERYINKLCEEALANVNIDLYDQFLQKITRFLSVEGGLLSGRVQTFSEVEKYVKEIDKLRSIPCVYSNTIQSYSDMMGLLVSYLQQCRVEVERLVEKLSKKGEGKINFRRIGSALNALNTAEFIEERRPGSLAPVRDDINEIIVSYFHTTIRRVHKLPLDVANFKNLLLVKKLHKTIQSMESLKDFIDSYTESKEEVKLKIEKAIRTSISIAEKEIGGQTQIDTLRKQLQSLNELKQRVDNMSLQSWRSTKQYIQNGGERDKRIQELKQHLHEVSSKLEELEKIKLQANNTKHSRVNFLRQKGFTSIIKLEEGITKLKKEKAIDEENINKCTEEIENQKEVLQKDQNYASVKGESLLPDAGKRELQNHKISDYRHLMQEIDRLQKTIKDSEEMGDALGRLDANRTESCLKYFEEALKVLPDYTELINPKQYALQKHIESYFYFVVKCIEDNLEVANSDEAISFKSSQIIEEKYRELVKLKEHHPLVWKCFNEYDIIEKLEKLFHMKAIDLQGKMDMAANRKDNQTLSKHLNCVKSLSLIDCFLPRKEVFMGLYQVYLNKLNNNDELAFELALGCINSRDYISLPRYLQKLKASASSSDPDEPFEYVKVALVKSMEQFMKDTMKKATLISHNLELSTIENITDNLEKLESSALLIDNYLNNRSVEARNKCLRDIIHTLEDGLLQYIQLIEKLLDVRDLPAADEKLDLIKQAKPLLGTYCTNKITKAIDGVEAKHSKSLGDTIKEYENKKIEDYNISSLDELLARFAEKRNSKNYMVYQNAMQCIKEIVIKKFKEAIKNLGKIVDEEQREKRNLKYAIETLPESMRKPLQTKMKSYRKSIKTKQAKEIEKMDEAINATDTYQLKAFFVNYATKSNYLHILEEKLQKKTNTIAQEALTHLKADQLASCLELMQSQLLSYIGLGEGDYLLQAGFVQELKSSLTYKFNQLPKLSNEIGKVHKIEIYEKACADWTMLLECMINKSSQQPTRSLNDFLDIKDLKEIIGEVNRKFASFFKGIFSKYDENIEALNIRALLLGFYDYAEWEKFFGKYRSLSRLCKSAQIPIDDVFNSTMSNRKSKLSQKLQILKYRITNPSLLNEKTNLDKTRAEYFAELNKQLSIVKNVEGAGLIVDDGINVKTFEKECIDCICKKIGIELTAKGKSIIEKDSWDTQQKKESTLISKNLLCISLTVENHKINQTAIEGYQVINEQVATKLKNSIVQIQQYRTNIQVICRTLKKMKELVDLVPGMKETINQSLDEVLDGFKKEKDTLKKLFISLQGDSIGEEVLKHEHFKGLLIADWNETTARHGLKYILEKSEGDMFDSDFLAKKHRQFQESYDKLISKYLKPKTNFTSEIVSELFAQLKKIQSSIKHKMDENTKKMRFEWSSKMTDFLPELLALIFALWTLDNAIHYFNMGASDKNMLLTPHPAQIISIFRLLGVGYRSNSGRNSPWASNKFTNNLIQILTFVIFHF